MSLLCLSTTKSVRNRSLPSGCNRLNKLCTYQSPRSRSRLWAAFKCSLGNSDGLRSRLRTFLFLRLWKRQRKWCEQIIGAPVSQVVEEQLVAEETTQTSVEIRTQVEYVAPAPAASFAALDPAVLGGFQQALVNTLTKQQLDDATKLILR